MQLGMIGLGRMGGNMVRRLMRDGHQCVVFDLSPENVKHLSDEGAAGASSMEEFVSKLTAPRAAWVMVPSGDATEQTVLKLASLMQPGDTIIDGGNSYYKDDVRRSKILAEKGIVYCDVGTSGGVWGLERGYCMMIGGQKETVQRLDPIFNTLAPGMGDIPRTPGFDQKHSTAENGLPALRALRRGPLREDGPQRHRVRLDASLCRRLRHHEATPTPKSCRKTTASSST